MIWRLRIGRWRFTFTMAPVTEVVGVNSRLPDGRHILMWDFDETLFQDVCNALETVQNVYALPKIYIFETKQNSNYIAFCFKAVSWRKAVEIVAFTKGVDWNFFKYSIYRGWFTLRVGPKCGRIPHLIWILESDVPEDCTVLELKRWVTYETMEDDAKTHIIELLLAEGKSRNAKLRIVKDKEVKVYGVQNKGRAVH